MDPHDLHALLKAVSAHALSVGEAAKQLRDLPFHDMGFAKVDHHRLIRKGHPEVIFCQGKTVEQIIGIVKEQIRYNETVFGTRAGPEVLQRVKAAVANAEINRLGRCFWVKSKTWRRKKSSKGAIVIATAGTADIGVAEEARCTLEVLGHACTALHDVGVSGIHRLLAHRDLLRKASVVIAIAGMEGALPSVIAGMVSCPVIGVPTSVGYGAHLDGLVPMFAMLNSCASGLTVVNIDNGFGAGFAAALISTKRGYR